MSKWTSSMGVIVEDGTLGCIVGVRHGISGAETFDLRSGE